MSSLPDQTTTQADLGAVVEAIRGADRFLVTTHENPDGDALGSLLATQLALTALGKDSLMFLPGPAPLPGEYRFLPLEDLRRELPDDAAERTLVAVDAANESRLGADAAALHSAPFTVNIDHHHDNSRFGDVNLVDAAASSTGEVLRDVIRELGHRADARAGGAALRRARDRHRPLPVREHDARRRCGSPPSWSRPAPTCTRSSRASTRASSSRS